MNESLSNIPKNLLRTSTYLDHPVFNSYHSETEMLRTPNFGRKSLNEIKEVLTGMSLYLGMEIPNWPPENIAEMSKKLEEQI